MWPIISIAIGALLVIFLAVAIILQRKGIKRPPDYYNLFIIGIMWVVIGLPWAFEGNYLFILMGIVFSGIGLANQDKWKENRRKWKDLTAQEQKIKKALMIVVGFLIVIGFLAYVLSIK